MPLTSEPDARRQKLEDLLELAVARNPDERHSFLESRCAGDRELYEELLDRIRASEATSGPSGATGHQRAVPEEAYQPGERLGHYEILGKIGSGGMGIVYKALDTRLDRTVALKCLPPHLSKDSVSRQRFVVEAKSASRLDHPNICVIYEIGDSPKGDLFLTMPFYDGETLDRRIARGPLALTEAMSVTAQICEGLSAAHGEGIIHRDIKPPNLLLTTSGVIKILDFGLAKIGRLEMTQTGFQVGTLAYMAPERLAGQAVDHRADLWALGVVMFELLTGQRPWTVANFAAGAEDETKLHVSPSKLRPQLPAGLDAVLCKALAPHPDARHSSAVVFLQHVRAACGLSRGADKGNSPGGESSPVSHDATAPSSEPAWAPEQLAEIISELTRRIGPIAPMLVKRASSRCTDWTELCTVLADELPSEQERRTFIAFTSNHASSSGQHRRSKSDANPGSNRATLQLDGAVAARIEEALSREIGPISRELIARRREMDASTEDLCRSLAEFIDNTDSRSRFIANVRVLW